MLTPEERDWVNGYQKRVFDELSPHLDPEIAGWLREKTKPL